MRFSHTLVAASVLLIGAAFASAQDYESQKPASSPSSTAQSTPQRYANMPDEAVPYRKFTKPYKEWYVEENTLDYNGAARDRIVDEIEQSKTVNIGFLGPLENNPESPYGRAMLQGAQLAIEAANVYGGYGAGGMTRGKPYQLIVHNDSAQWGASSIEAVKMAFDDHVVAILGSIDGSSTHIMLRVSLKLEIPIMDTGTTDPTVTETRIPWLMHDFPDDRQQGYALAGYIFKERKLKRIGVLRTQSRYARVGVAKFFDEAKRLGRVPVLEMKFERGDQDFSTQLQALQNSHIDGLVVWGEPAEAVGMVRAALPSDQEGAAAYALDKKLSPREIERRRKHLMGIQRQISKKKKKALVGREFDLLLEGVIDSFGVVELVLMLEQRFGVEFDFDELEADDMTRIGPLAAYVERKLDAT